MPKEADDDSDEASFNSVSAEEDATDEDTDEDTDEYPETAAARGGRVSAGGVRSPKSAGRVAHRPPLWSVDRFGSAHGGWDRSLALAPNTPMREVGELEQQIRQSVLSIKNRYDVAAVFLSQLLGVGDHGYTHEEFCALLQLKAQSRHLKAATGRTSVQKFCAVLKMLLLPRVKAKMKAARKKAERAGATEFLEPSDPLCSVQGIDSTSKRPPTRFLTLTEAEAQTLFRKYGHDSQNRLPYDMFARRLFSSAAHSNAAAEGRRRQPFLRERPEEWAHEGNAMIQYRLCRRGVFAPSNWADVHRSVCERSAQKPEAFLKLEHVFGYSGLGNTAPNLRYVRGGRVVYYTAGVGIVYDPGPNRQRFFVRHTDDVQCLARHPDGDTVATGQVAPLNGARPVVWVWSATTCKGPGAAESAGGDALQFWGEEAIKITLPYGQRSVQALAFSEEGQNLSEDGEEVDDEDEDEAMEGETTFRYSGDLLVTVSTDNEHTVNVWKWREKGADGNAKLLAYAPNTQVFCVVCRPPSKFFTEEARARHPEGHEADFVTAGVNHIKFWTLRMTDHSGKLRRMGERLVGEVGNFNPFRDHVSVAQQQNVHHVAYLPTGFVAAAGELGSLTLYEGRLAVAEISAHRGPCRCLCVKDDEAGDGTKVLLSGGDDGMVIEWQIPEQQDEEAAEAQLEALEAHYATYVAAPGTHLPPIREDFEKMIVDARHQSELAKLRPLPLEELQQQCREEHVDDRGTKETLERRLVHRRFPAKSRLERPCSAAVWSLLASELQKKYGAPTQQVPDDFRKRFSEQTKEARRTPGEGLGAALWRELALDDEGQPALPRRTVPPDPMPFPPTIAPDALLLDPNGIGPLMSKGDVPKIIALDVDEENPTNMIVGSKENDIWEVEGGQPRVLVEGQSADVFGLAPCPAYDRENQPTDLGSVYASGCEDGQVYLWDAADKKSIKAFEIRRAGAEHRPRGCNAGEQLRVKAVAFWLASGDDGLFAVSTAGVVGQPGHPDLGGVVQVFRTDAEFFVESDESFDEHAFVQNQLLWEWKDTNEVVDDIKFSPSGEWLAAASHDNHIYMYSMADGKLHSVCRGHSSYVTHIDWSQDSQFLASTSGDYELLYWSQQGENADAEAPAEDERGGQSKHWALTASSTRDTEWASPTCVLGFNTMGIWQEGMDGTDVNALHVSHSAHEGVGGRFCVASTDDGLVRLFNYPVVIEKAPHHSFRGHSSHVQNVRFLSDDTRVISAGGHDRSMMQWRTVGVTSAIHRSTKKALPKARYKAKAVVRKKKPVGEGQVVNETVQRALKKEESRRRGAKEAAKEARLKKEKKINEALLKEKDDHIERLQKQLARERKPRGGGGGRRRTAAAEGEE